MRQQHNRFRGISLGFTLVELLVVIGIIALLISILLPALAKARKQANAAACASNEHQLYLAFQIYSTESRGWLFPVNENVDLFDNPNPDGDPGTFGTNFPPHERWPAYVKAIAPSALKQDPISYNGVVYALPKWPDQTWHKMSEADQMKYDATPFTPALLRCPEDSEVVEAHSYVLNHHLADARIRFGVTRLGTAHSSSNVVVVGEKKSYSNGIPVRDYYMEDGKDKNGNTGGGDFARVVEERRHGIQFGSNYLFMDGHVDNRPPNQVAAQLDPWANVVTDPAAPVTPPSFGS